MPIHRAQARGPVGGVKAVELDRVDPGLVGDGDDVVWRVLVAEQPHALCPGIHVRDQLLRRFGANIARRGGDEHKAQHVCARRQRGIDGRNGAKPANFDEILGGHRLPAQGDSFAVRHRVARGGQIQFGFEPFDLRFSQFGALT